MNVVTQMADFVIDYINYRRTRRVYRQALKRAYATFASQHRLWVEAFFDEYFLNQQAAGLLARTGQGNSKVTAYALAVAYSRQFTWSTPERQAQVIAQATPVARQFLRLFEAELGVRSSIGRLARRSV